jgi:hypothetical protein
MGKTGERMAQQKLPSCKTSLTATLSFARQLTSGKPNQCETLAQRGCTRIAHQLRPLALGDAFDQSEA